MTTLKKLSKLLAIFFVMTIFPINMVQITYADRGDTEKEVASDSNASKNKASDKESKADIWDYYEVDRPLTMEVDGSYKISGTIGFKRLFNDAEGVVIRLFATNDLEMIEVSSTVANKNGEYEFDGYYSDGSYIAQVDATIAYKKLRTFIDVEGEDAYYDLLLTPTGLTQFQVSGTVTGIFNLGGVIVNAKSTSNELLESVVTDSNGKFQFTKIPHGDFSIEIDETDSYFSSAKNSHIYFGHINGEDIALISKYYNMTGSIKGDGLPNITGKEVSLLKDNVVIKKAKVDANGNYCFEQVPIGDYKVKGPRVTGFFYAPFEEDVSIVNKNINHDIRIFSNTCYLIKIVDRSGKPLPNTYIKISCSDRLSHIIPPAYTDENGEAIVETECTYLLPIPTYNGFTPANAEINADKCKVIKLAVDRVD